jgi:hypothetical protein
VERDLTDLLRGLLFDPIAADDQLFREVRVEYGTLVWPGGIDIAPETLIWDGPPRLVGPPHGLPHPFARSNPGSAFMAAVEHIAPVDPRARPPA